MGFIHLIIATSIQKDEVLLSDSLRFVGYLVIASTFVHMTVPGLEPKVNDPDRYRVNDFGDVFRHYPT